LYFGKIESKLHDGFLTFAIHGVAGFLIIIIIIHNIVNTHYISILYSIVPNSISKNIKINVEMNANIMPIYLNTVVTNCAHVESIFEHVESIFANERIWRL
jgi:hypothetical protein